MSGNSADFLLSFDQGTTSSRAILFTTQASIQAVGQHEFTQHFPQPGWVEHDPEEIWSTTLQAAREAVAGVDLARIRAAGITNQRETTLVWERATGKPVYNAIVWQDRRTAALCQSLKEGDPELEARITARTGLLLDPYFSATKLAWILDNVDGARERAERGELAFGTVDTFLLWRLTNGSVHATDASNASRTLLFNIHQQGWDDELLELFRIPRALLPDVRDSAADYGVIDPQWLGAAIPVGGVAGDQQAALVGQACFRPGMAKSTYGTGCFMVMNTGTQALTSQHRLLTTVAYRLKGETTYAIEGSIFMAGATIQWIRDGLHLIRSACETQSLAEATGYENPVYMVPAFTGLGAPYWDPQARGAIMGLTRDTGIKEIVTAGLQAVCYQTRDLLEAMHQDGVEPDSLRVDGGMVANHWLVQFLTDILGVDIARPKVTETTALGAAFLAGLQCGVYDDLSQLEALWQHDQAYRPALADEQRERLYKGWLSAVERVRSSA
ncbi:glycerol kinase GlpK [Thalassolituus sp. LLYu03]|uniref:glycerol kinase GlpK n=1 Tax=Thalassolituus sp. LLYu03 TaxID=3421656 RepID=UPI003D290BC0